MWSALTGAHLVVILAQRDGGASGLVFLPCLFIPCVGILVLVLLAFWIWMIVDVATREPSEGNDKIIWLLVVLLTGWIGALIYFFARRPTRIRRYGR